MYKLELSLIILIVLLASVFALNPFSKDVSTTRAATVSLPQEIKSAERPVQVNLDSMTVPAPTISLSKVSEEVTAAKRTIEKESNKKQTVYRITNLKRNPRAVNGVIKSMINGRSFEFSVPPNYHYRGCAIVNPEDCKLKLGDYAVVLNWKTVGATTIMLRNVAVDLLVIDKEDLGEEY